MARFHPGKGQDHLLRILAKLKASETKDFSIIFLGAESFPGEKARLEKIRSTMEIRENVFIGNATSRPQAWIDACDALVSGSDFEGLPLSPLEALGAGKPVWLSDIPGHRALGELPDFFPLHAPNGEDIDSLRKFLAKLTQQSAEDAMVRWQAAEGVRNKFGADQMVENYEKNL